MFELMIMTEEMKKKLDPDAYSCAIDKSANLRTRQKNKTR